MAALLTCRNLVHATLRCLESLFGQVVTDIELDAFLVDAGSTDGAAGAIVQRFPQVNVVPRGDDLYWRGGTRVTLVQGCEEAVDYYLGRYDDVVLDADALATWLTARVAVDDARRPPSIAVGSTRDLAMERVTYGDVVRSDPLQRLRNELVVPEDQPQPAEIMNGNCVLVPREVFARIGTLVSVDTHGMADFDYGHRARRAGCEVWVAPGTVGTCPRNEPVPEAASLVEHGRRASLRRPDCRLGSGWPKHVVGLVQSGSRTPSAPS